MAYRSLVTLALAAATLIAPVPALAQTRSAPAAATPGAEMARAADALADPRNQQAVAGAMAAMIDGLMQIKAAPFARAMAKLGDPAAQRVPENATLADLAGPEARAMPREVAHRVPQMMGAMAGMTGAMQALLPQLEAVARRMGEAMAHAAPRS